MDAALLSAQLTALAERVEGQRRGAENARILRHDVRHYLPMLSRCLRAGDAAGARAVLDAMRALAGEEKP